MQVTEHKDKIEIRGVSDFVPELIFDCGQCFRWEAAGEGYIGVAKGKVARVWTGEGSIFISGTRADFDLLWRGYFDLDRDYGAVRRLVSVDAYMAAAAKYGEGIRILRQDPWEALCSFIISQCNNIARIRGIIDRLCRRYGKPLEYRGEIYYDFPSADTVASLNLEDLEPLRSGYRAKYIMQAAKRIASGKADLEEIARLPQDELRKELLQFDGVGEKVANCVMLFGLGRIDAFPVDVWIRRSLEAQYGKDFDPAVFGGYAGIAQQYMFHYARKGEGLAV